MNEEQKALLDKQVRKLNGVTQDKEEAKSQAKSLGVKIPDELALDFQPLFEHKKGHYRIDEKHFALMFLEAFQNEDKITGELAPLFTRVEQMIGIPKSTLGDWWRNREDIMSQRATVLHQGLNYVSTAMMVEMMRMAQAMATIDYKEMVNGKPQDMHNFISLFNTMINKFRLLNNQSTSNVAHAHEVELVIPD